MKRLLATLLAIPIVVVYAADETVPIEQEPRHRLVFENAHVRHFDVQLEPGYVSVYHWHRNDGVFVNIRPSELVAQDLGAAPKARGWRAIGETYFIGYSEKPKAHRVSNTGDRGFHVTDTEILQECGSAHARFETGRNQTLIVDNPRVYVTRIMLHPGESTDLAGPCGMLISLYAGEVQIDGDGKSEQLSLPPGGYRWREAQAPYRLTNTRGTVFHGVDIRIK